MGSFNPTFSTISHGKRWRIPWGIKINRFFPSNVSIKPLGSNPVSFSCISFNFSIATVCAFLLDFAKFSWNSLLSPSNWSLSNWLLSNTFIDFASQTSILNLSLNQLENLIYPVGFYKVKAKRIKEISKTIINEHGGNVPDDFNELMKLKGVGRKTANIVMVYGHKRDGFIPVDIHCHRVPNRIGWINTKTPEETESELKRNLPKIYWNDFNHLFVKFGQTICVPTSPFCSKCPIYKYCQRIDVKKNR